MGLAYLSGQLDTVAQPVLGVDYLRRAALFATVDSPQAAYTFGMLLSGESSLEIPFPSHILISPTLPISTPGLKTQLEESKSFILRAAYLCHPPAQYKAGMMYEHARLTCPYDPLLSVQYYALASQEGELEADMALSKWFLVGAEGCFEKNEELTRTFAEKAGKGRLPIALFALGYYNE
jgi:TPR repeat protein